MSLVRPCYLTVTIMRNGKADQYHDTEADAHCYMQSVIGLVNAATTPSPYVAVAIYNQTGELVDMWVNAVDFNNRLGTDHLTLEV